MTTALLQKAASWVLAGRKVYYVNVEASEKEIARRIASTVKKMHISFTGHAFHRVKQRLSLLPEAVAELLNRRLWIDVGTEEGTTRTHCLFLSPHDNLCFVAILDTASEQVITILPLNYHTNLAWTIPYEKTIEARKLRPKISTMLDEMYPRIVDPAFMKPQNFKITACCGKQGKQKIVGLGSLPADQFEARMDLFLKDKSLSQVIEQRMKERGIDVNDVCALYVRLGNNGKPVSLTLG